MLPAPAHLRDRPPKRKCDPGWYGFRPRFRPKGMRREPLWRDATPSGGYPAIVEPKPSQWWEQSISELLPEHWSRAADRVLNRRAFVQLANDHTSPAKALYLRQCVVNGFPNLLQHPLPFSRLTANRITPSSPVASAVESQILRAEAKGARLSCHLPILPGTDNLPLGINLKLSSGKVKLRPTANGSTTGSHPFDSARSRKAWTPLADVTFGRDHHRRFMALVMRCDAGSATVKDIRDAFELILRNRHELAKGCYWWKSVFDYLLTYGFGESPTPHHADDLFGLIERELDHRIQAMLSTIDAPGRHPLDRQCDDFIVLHPVGQRHLATTIDGIATDLSHWLGFEFKDAKDQVGVFCPRYNGYVYDLPAKLVGYPRDKSLKLHHSLKRAFKGIPFEEAESMLGWIECLVDCDIWCAPFVPDVRICILAAKEGRQFVRFNDTARSDLQFIASRLEAANFEPWCPISHHLITSSPDIILTTDASGDPSAGVGGFTNSFHFTILWSALSRLISARLGSLTTDGSCLLADSDSSTAFIEMLALYIALDIAISLGLWINSIVEWRTDSSAAVGAWAKLRSPAPLINTLIKRISRRSAAHGILIHAVHFERETDGQPAADALSRNDYPLFLALLQGLGRTAAPSSSQVSPAGAKDLSRLISRLE